MLTWQSKNVILNVDAGTSSPDLTDAEMNQVYNSAGGEAEYGRLTSWAAQNLSETKLNAFNDMIDRGNATAIQIAVSGLRAEYEAQEGYEGECLQAKQLDHLEIFLEVKLKLFKQ